MRQMRNVIGKLPKRSLRVGVRLEIEAWIISIAGALPGFVGMLIRNLIYRALFKKLNGLALIQNRVVFVHTNNLQVGSFFGCNSGTYINALGGITIGNNVLIGTNVTISSGKHNIDRISSSIFEQPSEPHQIIINDGVWIGAGAVIMPGVTLGASSVIGANSVVTKNTLNNGVYAGAPARLIRMRIT